MEYEECLLIIEDRKGRQLAQELGINIAGTLGIIATAKLSGIIPSVKSVLEKIQSTNFRITDTLAAVWLRKAGE